MSRWVCKTAVETFLRLCNKSHTFSNPIKLTRRIYGGLKSHNMNLIYLYCRQTTQSDSLNISFVLDSKTICITRSKFCLKFVNMMNIFQIYLFPLFSSSDVVVHSVIHLQHMFPENLCTDCIYIIPLAVSPHIPLFFMSFIFPDAIIQFPNSNH